MSVCCCCQLDRIVHVRKLQDMCSVVVYLFGVKRQQQASNTAPGLTVGCMRWCGYSAAHCHSVLLAAHAVCCLPHLLNQALLAPIPLVSAIVLTHLCCV
jgi:hypothetical protein